MAPHRAGRFWDRSAHERYETVRAALPHGPTIKEIRERDVLLARSILGQLREKEGTPASVSKGEPAVP